MKRQASMDFDVITGPSMASACPVVDAPVAETSPAASKAQKEGKPSSTQDETTKADAA